MHKNVLEPMKYDNLISSLNNLQHHIQEKKYRYEHDNSQTQLFIGTAWGFLDPFPGQLNQNTGGQVQGMHIKINSQQVKKHSPLGSAGLSYLGAIRTEKAYLIIGLSSLSLCCCCLTYRTSKRGCLWKSYPICCLFPLL